MTFVLTKTGETNIDFTSAALNSLSAGAPHIYAALHAPPAFPYPVLLANWNLSQDAYSFTYPNGNGVYHPSALTTEYSSGPAPSYTGTLNQCIFQNYIGTDPLSIGFSVLPFGAATDGGSIAGVAQNLKWTYDTQPLNPVSFDCPLTKYGNGMLNGWQAGTGEIFFGSTAGVWYNAFNTPGGIADTAQNIITHFDGSEYNYTIMESTATPPNKLFGVKWRPSTFSPGGATDATVDTFQLSNSTDDALFQGVAANTMSNDHYLLGNTNEFFLSIVDYAAGAAVTPPNFICFAISHDLTSYRRINVTVPGVAAVTTDYSEALYFEDIDGVRYTGGSTNDGYGAWQSLAAPQGGGGGTSRRRCLINT